VAVVREDSVEASDGQTGRDRAGGHPSHYSRASNICMHGVATLWPQAYAAVLFTARSHEPTCCDASGGSVV